MSNDKLEVYVNGCTCGGCMLDVSVYVNDVEAVTYSVEPYGDDAYTMYPEDNEWPLLLDPPPSLENLAESVKAYYLASVEVDE